MSPSSKKMRYVLLEALLQEFAESEENREAHRIGPGILIVAVMIALVFAATSVLIAFGLDVIMHRIGDTLVSG